MRVLNAVSMGDYCAAWQHGGYCGSGNVSGLLDALRGRTAIVCGNAEGVFEETGEVLKSIYAQPEYCWYGDKNAPLHEKCPPVLFAVNDVGMYLPHVDHWVSLHGTKLKHWAAIRRDGSSKSIGNTNFITHAVYDHDEIDYCWRGLTPIMALSGYFAMQIAYLMGAERIILCGCPGDSTPRFWETGPRSDNFDYQSEGVRSQIEQEMTRLPEFKERVRSMSGWSKDFFGGV